jgi:hypothetical protein
MSSPPLPTVQTNTKKIRQASQKDAGIPWYIWFGALAVTSSCIGLAWDIAWHRSIGRDTFWTPAHMAVQACGVIAAIICGYLIAVNTFGSTTKSKTPSVNVLGFRAPLGAFIAAWGGITMITSAPFDNWWHAAYGLDIQVISPPHTLLILGIRAVDVGILFLILAVMNRASDDDAQYSGKTFLWLRGLFLYIGGLILCEQMLFIMEYIWDVKLHSASAYIPIGLAVPVIFAVLSQASRYKWAATSAAVVYTIIAISEILIFPLVPAQPKLGPVFNPVTHLIPTKFPLLLFVPALALDLLWQKTRAWKPWKIALVSGFLFIAVLIIVEWPFASFLLSKASQNRFFGTIYFDYNSRPEGYDRLRRFAQPDYGISLYLKLLRAAVYASVSTWIGLSFGRWMRSVQR